MRVASYVHLTASLRVLLDRKDRLSMATGLEVRVPYCDHRLVEFVYNAPWALKAFDGREKSLLRAAARDLLPDSVVGRVKTAYPSTQHPGYLEALRGQVAALAAEPDHAVFEIVDRSWLQGFAQRDAGAATGNDRHTADWILNLATWLDDHQPLLRLP
jgi:asparagine synthase (glutamine-hydrolysing)